MNNYELMLVVKAGIEETKKEEAIELAKSVIGSGGEVVDTYAWGNRKLAYSIQDLKEGYYVIVTFKANPDVPKELTRRLNILDSVLRFLITIIPSSKLTIDRVQKVIEPAISSEFESDIETLGEAESEVETKTEVEVGAEAGVTVPTPSDAEAVVAEEKPEAVANEISEGNDASAKEEVKNE
jgi:small subunit ribosomal protein S6